MKPEWMKQEENAVRRIVVIRQQVALNVAIFALLAVVFWAIYRVWRSTR